MKLYLVAGEASGDARGAELINSLRARRDGIEFRGFGGPQMAALTGAVHDWVGRAAVIGIIDVVKNYGYFRRQFAVALDEIATEQPDAVVLIDYPGFNLRLAAALKKAGTKAKVIDYISPQVWAWNRGRIPRMARILDLMICIFPFEKPLYEQSGLKTLFVGHPMLDSLANVKVNVTGAEEDEGANGGWRAGESACPCFNPKPDSPAKEVREQNLLGLFPGSREREVKKIFPVMIEAARLLHRTRPGLRIEAAAASEKMRDLMADIARYFPDVDCKIAVKSSHELMQLATVGMVASGTATLEAAYFQLPFVLLYKAAWLTFLIGRRLVKVKWLGMPNILAESEIVREFLQEEARPEPIAAELGRLLDDEAARAALTGNLRLVISKLGEPGASGRAAGAILAVLR